MFETGGLIVKYGTRARMKNFVRARFFPLSRVFYDQASRLEHRKNRVFSMSSTGGLIVKYGTRAGKIRARTKFFIRARVPYFTINPPVADIEKIVFFLCPQRED